MTPSWGDALLFVGFSSFILELCRFKRAQIFSFFLSFFLTGKEIKAEEKEFTFFVPFALCADY